MVKGKKRKKVRVPALISRAKALDLMQSAKGQFFTAVFTKKDGTERVMNCQYLKDQEEPKIGYVKVKDAILRKASPQDCIRNINLQTMKSLKIKGANYKIR